MKFTSHFTSEQPLSSQKYIVLTNHATLTAPIGSNVIAGALGLQAPYSVESIRFNSPSLEDFFPRIEASMSEGVRRVYVVDPRGFGSDSLQKIQGMCRDKEMGFLILQDLANVQEVAKNFRVDLT